MEKDGVWRISASYVVPELFVYIVYIIIMLLYFCMEKMHTGTGDYLLHLALELEDLFI